MLKFPIVQFIREVRQEIVKVVWPNKRETVITSCMVFIMTLLSSLFFLLSDTIVSNIISYIFKFGLKVI